MLTFVLFALRTLAAAWFVAATFWVSYSLAWTFVRSGSWLLRWVATGLIGMWLATVGFAILRPLGGFTPAGAMLGVSALAAGVFLAERSAGFPIRRRLAGEARTIRRVWSLHRRSPQRVVTFFFMVFVALVVVRPLIVPMLGWDTLTYHGVRAALWVQTGQATFDPAPGPWSLYRNFLSGSEVLMAWAMLPFHNDLLAGFASSVQWLCAGLAFWAFAREIGLREPYAGTSALVCMFVPTLRLSIGSGYVEPALVAALFAAMAIAARCLRPRGRGAGPFDKRLWILCGAGLGLAAGMKPTVMPLALVIGAAVAVRALILGEGSLPTRLAWILGGVFAAALPPMSWWIQAYLDTGYPLSPIPLSIGGLTLGVADPALTWYLDRPFSRPHDLPFRPYTWPAEWRALKALFPPPGVQSEALGLHLALPLLVFPIGLAALVRRRAWIAITIAMAVLTIAAVHMSKGISVPRILWPYSVARYVMSAILLAIPVSLSWCAAWPRLGRAYRALLLVAAGHSAILFGLFGWAHFEHVEIAVTCLGIALLAFLVRLAFRWNRRAGVAVALLAVVVGTRALDLRRSATRLEAALESTTLHGVQRHWHPMVPLVDDESLTRNTIAITAGPMQNADHWFTYFLLGRQFQNRLTYVSPARDGSIVPLGPTYPLTAVADPAAWLERLRAAGVTHVMSFPPESVEVGYMNERPGLFEKLAGTTGWGLWRFNGKP